MHLVSLLRIPLSFLGTIPLKNRKSLRERVSWHQYHMLHEVIKLRQSLPEPKRQNSLNVPSTSANAWYGTLRARTVAPHPTPEVLAQQTLFRPKERSPVRKTPPLTEARMLVKVALLEMKSTTSATRGLAIRMYQAVNPSWPSSNSIRARLSRIASRPWLRAAKVDLRGAYNQALETHVAERRALHDHSAHILRCIHTMARNFLRLWNHINGRLRKSLRDVTLAFQASSSATKALWEPLRQWMAGFTWASTTWKCGREDTMGGTSSTGSTNFIHSHADIPGGFGDGDTRNRGRLLTHRP